MLRTEAVWRQAIHPFVWKGSLYLDFVFTHGFDDISREPRPPTKFTQGGHCPSASRREGPHALDLTSNKNSSPFRGPHSQARASRQRLQEAPGGSHFMDTHTHRRTLVPPVLRPLHPALQRRDFPVLAEAVAEPALCTPGANASRGSCAAVAAGSTLLRFCGTVCNVIKCNKDTANMCWGLQLPARLPSENQALGMVEAPAFKVPGWGGTWAERRALQ